MISPLLLAFIALLYLMLLFAVARYADTRGKTTSLGARTTIYPLSLAIYCTSWTFFGSVGLATTSGVNFLAIYIGPILMMTLGFPILKRIVSLSKRQRTTSVADFLGARYGKNVWVAATATCISVIGAVPYISLQLKAVALSLSELMSSTEFGVTSSVPVFGDLSLAIVITLALFTILFGTRHADATEHQYGLMFAIALESAIKLAAFLTVGIFVTYFMFDGFADLFTRAIAHPEVIAIVESGVDYGNMAVLTLLSFLAFLMLPRQFHVAVVENQTEQELSRARWLFPLYLIAINLFVLPIAAAGILTFGDGSNGDGFVLALPAIADNQFISLVGFIGGLSAGTAMVIVACVALAIMISNHLVLPVYLRGVTTHLRTNSSMEQRILIVRRTAISVILLLAYLYYKAADNSQALASIGLVSFAAAAQLAPSMFVGLIWRRANATGAIAGMVIGFIVWLYMLFLPTLGSSGHYWGLPLSTSSVYEILGVSALTAGFLSSIGMNLAALVAGSILSRPSALDSYQAQVFISHRGNDAMDLKDNTSLLTINQVNANLISYLGRNRAKRAYTRYWEEADHIPDYNDPASGDYIRFSEETLASTIGSSSSRLVHSLLLKRHQETSTANLQLLDEASEAIQYNQSVMRNALDQLDQGITVFDAKFRLTFWNRRFRKLLNLPQEIGQAGTPMAHIIRQIMTIQNIGPKDASFEDIEARLCKLSKTWGLALPKAERILEIRSSPMPDGGLVIAWTDVTERMMVAEALHEANESLEKRVEERTGELVSANTLLEQATKAADLAYQSKTRFLAAAGHDLLQPLNAAKLYASTLQETALNKEGEKLTNNISRSLESVEEILGSVLAISRLDSTTHKPSFSNCSLQRIFEQIELELRPIAEEKNIELKVVETSLWVRTDPAYLRRLIQNLVSNAINYSERGTVLLGCRRRQRLVQISVIDTGLGISRDDRQAIFSEFERLENGAKLAPGLGLGLSIVERISKLLDHPIQFESELGKGTHFVVQVPRTMAESTRRVISSDANQDVSRDMNGLRVICIDNDNNILEGMAGLLSKWNCETITAMSGNAAVSALADITKNGDALPSIALVDFHLDKETGLDVVKRIRREISDDITFVLVTADRSNELKKKSESVGIGVLNKPVKPAALRALLSQIQLQKRAAE
jgi:Na+/proline symporter/signal transduction histidine kinase/CheY-like chemotaxis protein